MKTMFKISFVPVLAVVLLSCGGAKKDSKESLKADIDKLKSERAKMDEDIKAKQEALAKLDPDAANSTKIKLIGVTAVATREFNHYIDLRGEVKAENSSYITPRGMPGQVKAIFVKEGDRVHKGQLLLKLDDAIARQQYTAAKQQLEGIKTQLTYARDIYNRQKNLWDKGIGTEVQLIGARTNVEGLERQLDAATEQSKVALEQLNTANVVSDVDGIAESVNVKVGELFNGMNQILIVNKSKLKVSTDVPENYLARVQKGSKVEINIPDAGKTLQSTISLISQVIRFNSRGFEAEAPISSDPALKPNQSAVIRILDYTAANVVVIPVNVVQSDETGKYVYVMETTGKRSVARKRTVVIGEAYQDQVEIKDGLKPGEQLITDAFQNLYDGALVSTTAITQ